jgi:hypothetical protein
VAKEGNSKLMRTLTTFVLLFCTITGFSRDVLGLRGSPKRDSLRRYHNTVDTNFIRKYPDRFIVTLSQSYRQYDLRFSQTMFSDTLGIGAPKMIADGNAVTGISIDFDKISFCFGIRSVPPSDTVVAQRGKTKYSSYSLSFALYRFRFESSFRKYTGFYDIKTAAYDTNITHNGGIYYQNPSMTVRSLRVKTLFVFNKRKFSYSSAYFNTQRQLKTAGSLLGVSNLYDYNFYSDTSLIPPASRPFYGQYGMMNQYRVQGISIGPGYSFNLVLFKTLYLNLTLTSGFDFQHRNIRTFDNSFSSKHWRVGAAGDFRSALGLNGKRMFLSVTYRIDYNSYINEGMHIEPRYHSVDFNFGYRFKMRRGRLYKKLNENKWYQLI